MADQKTDFFLDPLCDKLTTEALEFEPLFIREEERDDKGEEEEEEEEEEERFEDCVEELQTALGFSRKCRAAMEEEFSGLMAQMMAEIVEYDSLLHSATMGCCLSDGGHGHAHGYGGLLGGNLPANGLTPPPSSSLGGQLSLRAAGSPPGLKGALQRTGGTGLQLTGEGEEQSQHHMLGEQEGSTKTEDITDREVCPAGSVPEMRHESGASTVTGATVESGVNPVMEMTPETEVTATSMDAETEVTRDLGELGTLFEGCIAEVGRLEQRRDELVTELLELERPLAEGVQALRAELGEAQTQLQCCSLQKEEVRESIRLLKRQLFAVAKACAQSQMELSSRKHEVHRLSSEQEELQAQVQALTEEAAQLRSEHESRLQTLQEQQEAQGNSASSSADLSDGRRAPCDLQQYLQGALSALEEWYEPRLVALLKRRETGQEALQKAREQAQGLRSQLGPLRDEHQRLQLQRTCLEERFRLMEDQRMESVQQYKETVEQLEESSRELRMELQLQQRKTKEMEALKNSLVQQLCLYRASPEDHEEVKPPALGDHSNQQPSLVEVQT